ncbi:MAG: hypothetical protein OXU86_06545 [Thaumarchaeota archaeon]|nr:hypothetical protein [Nitrososphaerota archaeon]RNJ73880.1 MAG: hypothetical protein EB832_00900 [Thaumarchaeota archaeon S14]MDD9808618.1 hypothetical protein [Nitrososphaerota archaeon]MDD9813719.1 hypothetical protein [Nitrososphaerota archaeon]MDD9826408.1 hypothetical protein [Nitrososphaerota archaeon]
MNRHIMAGALGAVMALGSLGLAADAFAQYMGNVGDQGETGKLTLEEALSLQAARVQYAVDNPGSGSGTPYLSADSVLGATVISAAVFGGIAATFFVRARSGKYAAMGRG